jgi:hypothetical protein
MIAPTVLNPNHRVRSQPVVGVNDIKMAVPILLLKKMPNKRAAHLLDFIHETAVEIEGTKVMPNAVNLPGAAAAVTGPREYVDVMSLALEGSRQFRDMRRYTSDRYRV